MVFFTLPKLYKILLNNKQVPLWYVSLSTILPIFDINSLNRVAAFLSQTGHESLNYIMLQENLDYSEQSLLRIFPKYFNVLNVKNYVRRPPKIASRIYANRMGNGDELSQDGWKYRGRSLIQITGKNNYVLYSKKLYNDDDRLVQNPDLLLNSKEDMIKVACYFWKDRDLNKLADISDIVTMTKKINGGDTGLSDRIDRYNKAILILNGN
jgi:putative chitinase